MKASKQTGLLQLLLQDKGLPVWAAVSGCCAEAGAAGRVPAPHHCHRALRLGTHLSSTFPSPSSTSSPTLIFLSHLKTINHISRQFYSLGVLMLLLQQKSSYVPSGGLKVSPEPAALSSFGWSSAASRALQGIPVFAVMFGVTETSPTRKLLSLELHKFNFYNCSYQSRNVVS